jgi:hypothetical protein
MPKQDRVNVCAARAAPADAIEPATAHAFEQGGTQDSGDSLARRPRPAEKRSE